MEGIYTSVSCSSTTSSSMRQETCCCGARRWWAGGGSISTITPSLTWPLARIWGSKMMTRWNSTAASCPAPPRNLKKLVQEGKKHVQVAEKDLDLVARYLRIQEAIWVRGICEKLDKERQGHLQEAEDDLPEGDEEVDPETVRVHMLARGEGGSQTFQSGDDGEGIIDTGELQDGFIRQSWLRYFMTRGFSNYSRRAFDWLLLPGWNRAFPAGPARLFAWIDQEARWKSIVGARQEQRHMVLLQAAQSYFEQRKTLSRFPMALEELVIRLQEIRLKEAVLLLGRQLQFQGKIAVPPCRWMTPDELLEHRSTLKIKALKVSGDQERLEDEDDLVNVEKIAVHQAGFIFQAYKVTARSLSLSLVLIQRRSTSGSLRSSTCCESETRCSPRLSLTSSSHRFLMMGIVNFIFPDSPQQTAAGCAVAFASLLLAIYYRPFINRRLNTMYQLALFTQVLTLFCESFNSSRCCADEALQMESCWTCRSTFTRTACLLLTCVSPQVAVQAGRGGHGRDGADDSDHHHHHL
mmetsp:Transcript_3859/g.9537  ORF Transcript_3859/g.9537 Transcript_3859/m.9537 type:complete len:522 (-) Transcript_3859:693-2258(-)